MSNHTKPNNVTTPLTVAPGDPHWSAPEHDQRSMEQLYDYHDPVSLQQGGYTTGGALTMFGKVGFEPGQAVMNVDHGTIYDMILTRRYGTQGTFDFVVSQDMKNSNGVLGDFRTDVEHGFDICKVDMDMTTLNDEVTAMSNNRFRVRMKDGEARKVLRVIVPYRTAVRTFDAVELEKEFTYWVKEKSYSFAGYNEWEHYKKVQPLHYEIMTDFTAAVNRFTSKASKINYLLRFSAGTWAASTVEWNGWCGVHRSSLNLPLRLDYTDEMIYNSNETKDRAVPALAYPKTSMFEHAKGAYSIGGSSPDMAPDPIRTAPGLTPVGEDGEKLIVREPKKYTLSHLEKAHELLTSTGGFQSTVSQHRTKYRVKTLPVPVSFVEPAVGLPGSDEWVDQFPVYDHDTLIYTVGNSYDTVFFSRVYADVNPMFIHDEVDSGPGLSTSRSWRPSMDASTVDRSANHYLTWFNSSVGFGYLTAPWHYGHYAPNSNWNPGDPDYNTKIANESASERSRIETEIRSLVSEVSGYDSEDGQLKLHHEANFYIAGSTPASSLYDYVVGNTDSTSFRSKKLDLHTATTSQIWDSDYTTYDQPTQGEVVFTGNIDHVVLNDDSRSAIFNWKGVVNDMSIKDGVFTRYCSPPVDPIYSYSASSGSMATEIKYVNLSERPGAIDNHVEQVLAGEATAGAHTTRFSTGRGARSGSIGSGDFSALGPAIVPAIRQDGKTPYIYQALGFYENAINIYSPHGRQPTSDPINFIDTWYTKLLQSEPAVGTWTQNDISLSGVQGPGEDNTSHVLYDLSNLTHEQDTYKQNANLKGYYKSCVNHNNRELRLEISKYNESDPVDLDLTTRSEVFINKAPIYEVLAHAQYDDTVREEYRMSPAPTMRNLATWHDTPTEPSVVDQIFVPDGALNASDVLFLSLEAGSLSGGSIPTSKQVIAAPVKAGTLQIVSTSNPSNAQISKFTTPIIRVTRGNTYILDTYIFKNTGGKPITIHLPLNPGDPLVVGETSYVETLDASTGAVTNASGDKTDDWTVTISNPGNLSQAQVNGLPLNNTYIMQPDDTLEMLVELNVTSHASTYDISIPVKIDNDGLLTTGGIVFPTISIT
ncbi:hypothetical protein OAU81_00265 [bacterium]|nr:hypothetical protein [bacterium]